jgi:hypothetical protein
MKKVLYIILGILVLYIVLAFCGPKQIKVERQVTINKANGLVKEKLSDYKFFHDHWSPWTEKDPAMKTTYEGNPGEIGHRYTWSGNKDVGSGAMKLVAYSGDTIMQTLTFEREGDSKAYFILKDDNGGTNVTWGMMFDVGFMGRPFMLFMNMDKMLGEDYEKGLSKLKNELESMKDAPMTNYEIMEHNWEEKTFVGTKREKMNASQMGAFFGTNFPKLGADLGKGKIQPEMAPSALVYSWDEKTMDCECAAVMAVPKGTKMKGWETHVVPAAKVLHVAYYGAYEKSGDAHMAIGKYMQEKGLKDQVVIEEYVTDPMVEKDTAKWLTNIYYVLK